MNDTTILGSIDDPALVERVVSRRDVLRTGGSAGARFAAASVPVALAMMARGAFAQGTLPQAIVDVLNFALRLEYLEADFYTRGLAATGLIPTADRPVFTQISKHETAHVALLRATLGSAAIAKPPIDLTGKGAFADVLSNYTTYKAVAQAFEDTGVRAYKGQAPALMSQPALLSVALRIHSVEARHACEIRRLRGQKGWVSKALTDVPALALVYAGEANLTHAGITSDVTTPATEAFDEPLSMDAVLAIVTPFTT
ncbi:MAG: ferritin-like domain-containing protein [Gemmatimonadales bacterium]|nr:ferritin-like domain-containing protein [Gemmatimonadales bacterium]